MVKVYVAILLAHLARYTYISDTMQVYMLGAELYTYGVQYYTGGCPFRADFDFRLFENQQIRISRLHHQLIWRKQARRAWFNFCACRNRMFCHRRMSVTFHVSFLRSLFARRIYIANTCANFTCNNYKERNSASCQTEAYAYVELPRCAHAVVGCTPAVALRTNSVMA